MRLHAWALLFALVPALAGAGALDVSAAASLAEPFKEIGALHTQATGQPVQFNFGATNELRLQIENGAPADVFASASAEEMDRAVKANAVAGAPAVFARNVLCVILPKDNPGRVAKIADLARPGVKFVTTHPNVPIGRYTAQVLENLGTDPAYGAAFPDGVVRNTVSLETNVKQVVAKLVLGEADAGIAYASDAAGANAAQLRCLEIPDRYNVEAKYPIAVTASSRQIDAARAFIARVLSVEGQAILAKYRFRSAGN